MKKLVVATLFTAACGDDPAKTPDAGVDSTPMVDAAVDAPPSWTAPQAHSFMLSAAGHDRIMGVSAGPNGSFYAAGYVAADTASTTPQHIVVVKLLPSGMPDPTFGTGGVLNTNVVFKGGNGEIDIATLADGSAIVSATVPANPVNNDDEDDTDIGLIKITPAGALDTNWGDDGVVVHSFNTSVPNGANFAGRDASRALKVSATGEIYVHGIQRGEGTVTGGSTPRIDTDFVVAKFDEDGAPVLAYGGNNTGKYVRDIYYLNVHTSATARGIHVFADGSVLAGGYAGTGIVAPAEGSPPAQAVVIRLNPDGTPTTTFGSAGTPGLFHEPVLGWQAEVYDVAVHGDKIVTGGYGRESKLPNINDFISIRLDAATGARDLTWGGTGRVFFDPTPSNKEAGSNCRGAFALPNGKTLLVGSSSRSLNTSGTPDAHPEAQDAVFAVLDSSGKLDTAYGTGIAVYKLGNDGGDQFWGAAVNGDKVLVAGFSQTVGTASATNNDDAFAVLLTLE